MHGPSGRQSHSAVYDTTTSQMILFGGLDETTNTNLNDVWLGVTSTNQDDSFTSLPTTGTAPKARHGHVATYDSNTDRMTIFGGGTGLPSPCQNDSWILTGANGTISSADWIELSPSGTLPGARIYAGGVYDPNTNALIIFGGSNCSTGYFNDVWVLSNANGEVGSPKWTKLSPSGTPPAARESASAVYDSTNNILIIYAGDAGGSPFSDVWVLSHANGSGGTPAWTQLSATGTAPMARTGHTAIFDSANDRMTIFGGINAGTTLADSWVLTSANAIGGKPGWVQLNTQGTAPSVAYHSAVYNAALNQMYAFGGISSQSKFGGGNNYAFTLPGANGLAGTTEKWVLGGPPVRYSQSAFYDSVTNALFVYAGQHATALTFGDFWEGLNIIGSTNLDWIHVIVNGTAPSDRFGHTGLYDSVSDRMMIFAGASGNPAVCLNDYHVLEHANTQGGNPTWLTISPTGKIPGLRTHQASVYVAATNQIIISGGYNCKSGYYNDVWVLSNANDSTGTPSWKQLTPTGTGPSARESSSAVYDSTTNSLIIYGGDRGGIPTGDLWILSHADGSGGTPAWTELKPSSSGPGILSGQTATYDTTNNRMTIYGGYNGSTVVGGTWVLSGANGHASEATWTQLASGQVRRFHSSLYDATSNQIITYGGATGVQPQDPVSDIYTLTDANGLP